MKICEAFEDLRGEEPDELFLESRLIRCTVDRCDSPTRDVLEEAKLDQRVLSHNASSTYIERYSGLVSHPVGRSGRVLQGAVNSPRYVTMFG